MNKLEHYKKIRQVIIDILNDAIMPCEILNYRSQLEYVDEKINELEHEVNKP